VGIPPKVLTHRHKEYILCKNAFSDKFPQTKYIISLPHKKNLFLTPKQRFPSKHFSPTKTLSHIMSLLETKKPSLKLMGGGLLFVIVMGEFFVTFLVYICYKKAFFLL